MKKLFSVQPFCPAVWKGYGLLWKCLEFLGIEMIEKHKKTRARYALSLLFPVLLLLQQIYFICVFASLMLQRGTAIEFNIPTIAVCLISIFLWFNIHKKKPKIRNLVLQFHRLELLNCQSTRSLSCGVNTCLAFGVFILFLTIVGHFNTMPEIRNGDDIFALSVFFTIENKNLELAVKLTICVLNLIALMLLPSMCAVMCGSIIFKCSRVLEDFCRDVSECSFQREELIPHLQKYKLLRQLIHNVSQSLSSTLFLLLCWQILNMYVSLASFMNLSKRPVLTNTIWFCVPALTVIPCSVVGLALSASRVQSKQQDVRTALQNIHNCLVTQTEIRWKSLAVVNSMLKISFSTMSASGIVELKTELILSIVAVHLWSSCS
ncbi:hypothetical protein JTE90_004710 [Oedothorax gibbosus]|uniref:Gustatory receptor n=1 Tax=Oedothorax gibbosus TaxID=931172 RepID=A0AAV6TQJ6_9ARAC|nr:hypothetical protein JTE90_004710 [Oedothorax gibbosus]